MADLQRFAVCKCRGIYYGVISMAFTPSTIVYLLNVPLTSDNKNQIDFSDVAAQTAYFSGRIQQQFTDFTYQRKDNIIRVPVECDILYNCNYVMYQNANFTGKWFYAFITEIEYINPNCTAIHIKTDVFQTWQFDITYRRSMVLREHVSSDNIGANSESEPITATCYPRNAELLTPRTDIFSDNIILYFSKVPESIDGVFNVGSNSGADTAQKAKLYENLTECLADVETLELNGEMELIESVGTGFNGNAAFETTGYHTTHIVDVPFTPKNNKCYNYCYGLIVGNDTLKIDVVQLQKNEFSYSAFGEYGSTPFTYINVEDIPNTVISYDSYPQAKIPLNTALNDIAKSLIVNYKNIPYNILSGTINSVFSTSLKPMLSTGANMADTAISALSSMSTENLQPSQLSGFTPSSARYSAHFGGVWLIRYSPNNTVFEKIDNFFSIYGYAVNMLKIPQFNSRTNWNYIETKNINISVNAPQTDIVELKQIFDNGVTIWHNPSTFGNYALNNGVK